LRFAQQEAMIQERLVCRNCTEQLFDELEEDRRQCRRDLHALERDVAVFEQQTGDEPEAVSGEASGR
jgi:hypothetical protein